MVVVVVVVVMMMTVLMMMTWHLSLTHTVMQVYRITMNAKIHVYAIFVYFILRVVGGPISTAYKL